MSVIITGIECQKSCKSCNCKDDENEYCFLQDLAMTEDEWKSFTPDKQYKNCPLKSVEGLIEKIRVYRELPVKQVIEIIKEYCEVSEDE